MYTDYKGDASLGNGGRLFVPTCEMSLLMSLVQKSTLFVSGHGRGNVYESVNYHVVILSRLLMTF